jgi:hypothetical protein
MPGPPPDQRAWLVSLATMPEGGAAVDLGCAAGEARGEQAAPQAAGRYFYSVTGCAYVGTRTAA